MENPMSSEQVSVDFNEENNDNWDSNDGIRTNADEILTLSHENGLESVEESFVDSQEGSQITQTFSEDATLEVLSPVVDDALHIEDKMDKGSGKNKKDKRKYKKEKKGSSFFNSKKKEIERLKKLGLEQQYVNGEPPSGESRRAAVSEDSSGLAARMARLKKTLSSPSLARFRSNTKESVEPQKQTNLDSYIKDLDVQTLQSELEDDSQLALLLDSQLSQTDPQGGENETEGILRTSHEPSPPSTTSPTTSPMSSPATSPRVPKPVVPPKPEKLLNLLRTSSEPPLPEPQLFDSPTLPSPTEVPTNVPSEVPTEGPYEVPTETPTEVPSPTVPTGKPRPARPMRPVKGPSPPTSPTVPTKRSLGPNSSQPPNRPTRQNPTSQGSYRPSQASQGSYRPSHSSHDSTPSEPYPTSQPSQPSHVFVPSQPSQKNRRSLSRSLSQTYRQSVRPSQDSQIPQMSQPPSLSQSSQGPPKKKRKEVRFAPLPESHRQGKVYPVEGYRPAPTPSQGRPAPIPSQGRPAPTPSQNSQGRPAPPPSQPSQGRAAPLPRKAPLPSQTSQASPSRPSPPTSQISQASPSRPSPPTSQISQASPSRPSPPTSQISHGRPAPPPSQDSQGSYSPQLSQDSQSSHPRPQRPPPPSPSQGNPRLSQYPSQPPSHPPPSQPPPRPLSQHPSQYPPPPSSPPPQTNPRLSQYLSQPPSHPPPPPRPLSQHPSQYPPPPRQAPPARPPPPSPSHSSHNSHELSLKSSIPPPNVSTLPPLIRQSVEYLEGQMRVEGLYRESASSSDLKALKLRFDRREVIDLSSFRDPHTIAGLLKLHFREMYLPIFPKKISSPLMNAVAIEDPYLRHQTIREVLLKDIPSADLGIISFVFAHLNRVAEHSQVNKMVPSNLAVCWTPTLFRGASQQPAVECLIAEYKPIFLD